MIGNNQIYNNIFYIHEGAGFFHQKNVAMVPRRSPAALTDKNLNTR